MNRRHTNVVVRRARLPNQRVLSMRQVEDKSSRGRYIHTHKKNINKLRQRRSTERVWFGGRIISHELHTDLDNDDGGSVGGHDGIRSESDFLVRVHGAVTSGQAVAVHLKKKVVMYTEESKVKESVLRNTNPSTLPIPAPPTALQLD